MGYYSEFQYGSGVKYGMQTVLSALDPPRGPSPGGSDFVLKGSGFNPLQWNDTFISPALDTVKWSDISSGGSVSTGTDHLYLTTSAVGGSVAGIQSTAQWESCQAEARVNLRVPLNLPLADVCVFSLDLWVDSDNYCSLQVLMSSLGTFNLKAKVYTSGNLVNQTISRVEWTGGVSTFGILRFESDIYFLANGSVFWTAVCFVPDLASYRISCSNLTADYALSTLRVESFTYKPYAVFQRQPSVNSLVVSDVRLRGTVPPSKDSNFRDAAYAGLVDVSVVSVGTQTLTQAYEYYFVAGLKTIQDSQFAVELSVVNDPQLVTPAGASKGLGGGY